MAYKTPVPQYAGDPASPANGDIWYNTSTGKLRKREGGVTTDLDTSTGGGVDYYEPLTNGSVSSPELIFALGDCIMVLVV